jgi:hypothetical protein
VSTSDERLRILRMIEEGKVSPDEGAALLGALRDRGQAAPAAASYASHWIRIRVTEPGATGPNVNVRVPAGVMRAVAGLVGPHLERHGVDLPRLLAEAHAASGPLVQVQDDKGTLVEILVE